MKKKKEDVEVVPEKKEKKPKVELVEYSVMAIIPTGMYSNIQPKVTVKAKTMEEAERAVMPHIERLFAKYRDGNGQATPEPVKITETPTQTNVVLPSETPKAVLSTPFERAKKAVDACATFEALGLIEKQIEASTKLIESEKVTLRAMVAKKEFEKA